MTVGELSKIDREVDLGDQTIAFYKRLVNGGGEPDHTNLEDLLASLMHWARGYDMDFGHALRRAGFHFDEELAEHELGEMGYTGWFESARAKVNELKAAQRRDRQTQAHADGPNLATAASDCGIEPGCRCAASDERCHSSNSHADLDVEQQAPRKPWWLRWTHGSR